MYENMFASENLVGLDVNGWEVIQKLDAPDKTKGETGGNFSVCYIVRKDGQDFFMKVLDYKRIMTKPLFPGISRVSAVAESTQQFKYEIMLSKRCHEKKVKNVINYVDGGEIEINSFMFPTVSYIVYEKADGNIRAILNFSRNVVLTEKLKSLTFKLRSLHDISKGVRQLHNNNVSHQDIKPSNILSVSEVSKLGDLGRSLCFDNDVQCPYPIVGFNGDWTYAPPESYFNYLLPDAKERLYQIDNYMIGSLIVYYITGLSFNILLEAHLPVDLETMANTGLRFEDSMSYLTNAFNEALLDFESDIPMDDLKEGLVRIVSYLCEPNPERRGHPKVIGNKNRIPNYDLQRTITELDVLLKKTELGLIKK